MTNNTLQQISNTMLIYLEIIVKKIIIEVEFLKNILDLIN